MAQLSGPVGKRPFKVNEWRYVIGNEPGIKEDINGSAYGLTFSTNSDQAFLGSATQDSLCVVGGAYHLIPAGQPMSIEIPPALTGPRTDLIVVRYDEAFEPPNLDDPATADRSAPCRLYRIPGIEGSDAPAYDAAPPGVEDLPHWEVTRTPGTALSSNGTSKVDRRVRTGPNLYAESLAHIGNDVPLGTRARLDDGAEYVRVLDEQDSPVWAPPATLYGAGTALVGGTPPARARFLHQSGYQPITTQPDGAAIIGFPRPFPSGLLSLKVTLFTGVGVGTPAPATVVVYAPSSSSSRRPNLGSFHVVVHTPDGKPYPRGTFGIGYDAVGW